MSSAVMATHDNEGGASGVQGYVRSKNPTVKSEPNDFTDFKVSFMKAKIKKEKKERHLCGPDQSTETAVQFKTEEPHPFYDTDAASLEDTSNSFSVKEVDHVAAQATQEPTVEQDASSGEDEADSGESDEDEEPGDTGFDPRYRQGDVRLNSGQQHMFDMFFSQPQPIHGIGLPTVKGDSYPATTSGNPSPVPSVDGNRAHVNEQTQRPSGHYMAPPPAKSSQTMRNQSTVPKADVEDDQRPFYLQNGAFLRPATQEVLHAIPNAQFIFAPPPQPAVLGRTSEHRHARSYDTPNTLHRGTVPIFQPKMIDSVLPTKQKAVATARNESPAKRLKFRQPEQPSAEEIRAAAEREPVVHARHERISQERLNPGVDAVVIGSSPVSEQSEKPERSNLDYEEEDLFKMQYEDLKGQSFDSDPNANTFSLSNDPEHATLESKLEAVGKLGDQDKARFFESVSIDDWEQAGDWFITRFSGILEKLKASRREQRAAAKSFEDQVERRHAAVSKKRKCIEESLDEMKSKGQTVLNATPKRAKAN